MNTAPIPSSDECNAVAELRDLIAGLDATSWSSWQSTDKFSRALELSRAWLADYDSRKQP